MYVKNLVWYLFIFAQINFLQINFLPTSAFAAETICDQSADKTALVVIDMQPSFVSRLGVHKKPDNAKKVTDVIAAQVEAIAKAKEYKIPIVVLEYAGHGKTNSTIRDAVENYENVKFFEKNSDGMFEFYNKNRDKLIEYLKQNNIGTLILTGANGGACVLQSLNGSLNGNCSVLAYAKGIADFNFPTFIYPFAGKYKIEKLKCTGCRFSETSNIEDVIDQMARGGNANTASPSGSNTGDRPVR